MNPKCPKRESGQHNFRLSARGFYVCWRCGFRDPGSIHSNYHHYRQEISPIVAAPDAAIESPGEADEPEPLRE